ncbi:MAG TPA: methyltransferase [Bacilli bacterium]|nr:methyltransferase [Bacilli bacterium]
MENVVINDVLDYGIKIYQDNTCFKFSLDSVLLAEFIEVKSSKLNILDLCTGNCVIPLILANKYSNNIVAVELQQKIFNLAKNSVDLNKMSKQIKIINDNAINIDKYYKAEYFDIVSCNPPYFKMHQKSIINLNDYKSIARHELKINLEEIISTASRMLKNKGYFYLVHRTERLEEIIYTLNKYNLRIKNIQFVYTKDNDNSSLVLIKALKNGNFGLKVNPPIFINRYNSYKNIFKED